jgi:hypothetical protein
MDEKMYIKYQIEDKSSDSYYNLPYDFKARRILMLVNEQQYFNENKKEQKLTLVGMCMAGRCSKSHGCNNTQDHRA